MIDPVAASLQGNTSILVSSSLAACVGKLPLMCYFSFLDGFPQSAIKAKRPRGKRDLVSRRQISAGVLQRVKHKKL